MSDFFKEIDTGSWAQNKGIFRTCYKHHISYDPHIGCKICEQENSQRKSKENEDKGHRRHDIFENVVFLKFDNPLYITAKMLLADKRSWVKEYREDEYTCVDFAQDVMEFMTKREIRCGYTVLRFENGMGHAIIAFETDYGLVFFEPQTGDQEFPQIGKSYGSRLDGVPIDSLIADIDITWNS
jgi:hypothetical protein